jgi:uncharacterized protein DUF3768
MTDASPPAADAIRSLNDDFRRTFAGGVVLLTAGVDALPRNVRRSLLKRVREFQAFTPDNDPHREHDFGAVEENGVRFFWKIDTYDLEMTAHSPDPSDPSVTTRVLTIMLVEEY